MRKASYPKRDYRFGLSILNLRTASNLTQSGLSERLGVSRQTIAGWEAGTNYPSPKHLLRLIELCVEFHVFPFGQQAEEIRALWESTYQSVPMDETWLAHLLDKYTRPPEALVPGRTPVSGKTSGSSAQPPLTVPQVDWGDAPEVSSFYGRETELALLAGWLLKQRCRLVSILGMGGIGKTMLAARLVQEVTSSSEHVGFERAYWRSLRDAPSPGEWMSGAIGFLSDQQVTPPATDAERLTALLQLLRARRCLLVLDNFETLFEPGQAEGHYRAGLAGFGRLLRAVGETSHQSCLVLTSRETLPELAVLGGDAVRAFPLGGLGVDEAQMILIPKQLVGSPPQWAELTGRFGGNGLALKLVGERIRELFGGDIGLYLEEAGGNSVFGGIRHLLAEQAGRISISERWILRELAVAREPLRLASLLAALSLRVGRETVLEAVEALYRRSLLQRAETGGVTAFTLQSVVLEFVTDYLVEIAVEEVERGQPVLLVEQALIQATAKEYVRQTQERLIGEPILKRLKARLGAEGTRQRLLALLEDWRGRPEEEQGYGPGNGINLLRLLLGHLRGLDLSRLTIQQAYLAEVDAREASLVDAHLAEAVLADAFTSPISVALSGDGALLAAGTSTGQLWLWRVADRTLLAKLKGHTGQVWCVTLSADGHLLASSSADGTVRLWETSTRRLLATFEGHTGGAAGVALSADDRLLASGSFDGSVRLWETSSGEPLAILKGHTGVVWSVAFSADGHLLASGSSDGMVRLWEPSSGRLLTSLAGHTSEVWGVALSADGRLLASGSLDETVRLWEAPSGRPLATLHGHISGVWNLALSIDGALLASSGADGMVRLWEAPSGRPLATLQGHTSGVRGLTLSYDGHLLASGSTDETVRLWEAASGRPLATLQGHSGMIWRVAISGNGELVASGGWDGIVRLWEAPSGRPLAILDGHTGSQVTVALSSNGELVASGGIDGTVRLWEAPSGRPLAILAGHTSEIWGIALSADGQLVASCGLDKTVRLWEALSGRLLATLAGHTSPVRVVALSADGRLLASGDADGTLRLWEAPGGRPLATIQAHTGGVRGIALSADGHLLASGGLEGTVRLWESPGGRPLVTLAGHSGAVWGVALSADGHLVASSSADGTVRLWDAPNERPLATLRGHTGPIPAVALSAAGGRVASGGWDGTVQLWEAPSGAHQRTLRAEGRYARLNITGLRGITEAQRSALLALGAIDHEASTGPEGESNYQ